MFSDFFFYDTIPLKKGSSIFHSSPIPFRHVRVRYAGLDKTPLISLCCRNSNTFDQAFKMVTDKAPSDPPTVPPAFWANPTLAP